MSRASSQRLRGIRQNVRYRALTQNIGGMRENRAERYMSASEAVSIINMHSESEGSWTAHNIGYTNQNETAYQSGADFQGLHWFTEPDGTDHLVGAINGKFTSYNESTFAETELNASAVFSTSTLVDFQTFQGLVFACDGSANPRTYDGTTEGAAGGWPVDTSYNDPKYMEAHNGRLAFGNIENNPSLVIFSDVGDGETFTTGGSSASDYAAIQVDDGNGQAITGLKSVYIPQTNDTYLLVAKERSLYAITGRSAVASDADVFTVVKVNGSFGCVNNKCMVQVGNDVLMLGELPGGEYGIFSYTTALQNGTLQPTLVGSEKISETLKGISRSAIGNCYAVHLPARREVVFGIPTGGSTTVNKWIIYKYPGSNDETPKWSIRTGITHSCGLVYKDKMYFGTNDGYLSQWFTSPTYDGSPINWEYESPYMALGNEGQFKRIPTVFGHFKSSINSMVTLASSWLGGGNNNGRGVSKPLSSQDGAAVYNVAVYGQARYGSQVERKVVFKTYGNGERVKFTVRGNTTINGGPEFLGLTYFVEYGGTSHTHN